MKIGFSFGRCVRDLVEGKVRLDDVLMVVGRTRLETEEQVKACIHHYMYEPSYLMGLDQEQCVKMGLDLYRSGKLIQPRTNGVHVLQVPADYIWMDLYPTQADVDNEGIRQAWEHYRMMITLAAQLPDDDEREVQEVLSNGPKMEQVLLPQAEPKKGRKKGKKGKLTQKDLDLLSAFVV